MVKLPNLDAKEVQWIIQAMELYGPNVPANELEAYQHLLAMLRRREQGEAGLS